MKILQLFFLTLLSISCNEPELGRLAEIIYFNKSDDKIESIELELLEEETNNIQDVIKINKEIEPGDSLYFTYNTENFIASSHHTQLFTTVNFKNKNPILNKMVKENLVSGYFSGRNQVVLLLYIGNKNMLPCSRKKSSFPDVNLENAKCELELLNK